MDSRVFLSTVTIRSLTGFLIALSAAASRSFFALVRKSAKLHIPALLSAQTKIFQRLFLPDVRASVEPHVLVPIAVQADQKQAFWCAGRSTDSL